MNSQTQPNIDGPDITNYWQYFSLDRDPFSMGYDEALIYLSSYWEEMLDLAQYLVHYKNQIVALTGITGIGKTLFADVFVSQLGETVHIARLSAEANIDVMRFVEFLSDSFHLPWKPNQNVEEVLDEQLQAMQAKDKVCLVLIDSGHLLPRETLEALLYLVEQQSETQMRFHVMIVGEPALSESIKGMLGAGEENLVHFLSLEPLSLEETQSYLNYRLSAAGWQDENPMNEETTNRIFRLSEGNPARINRIARRFLLDMINARQETHTGSSAMRQYLPRIFGVLIVIIILAGIGFWYWDTKDQSDQGDSTPTVSLNGQAIEHQKPVEQVIEQKSNVTDATPATVAPSTPASPSSPSVNPAVTTTVSSPQPPPSAAPATIPVDALAQTKNSAAVPMETPVLTDVTSPPKKTSDENKAAASSPVKAKPVVLQKKESKRAPSAKTVASASQGKYTIQFISLSKEKSLNAYMKAHHLEGKLSTIKTKNGTIVVYGRYATMKDAERAVATLPDTLLHAGPWPMKI